MVARQLDEVVVPRGNGPIVSYEEFRDITAEGQRAEWVEGELIVLMPPDTDHQRLLSFLHIMLYHFVRTRKLGEIFIAPYEMKIRQGLSYREPDLLFVAASNSHRITAKRLDGPADLVVEIVSPDSVARDRRDKMSDYAAAGIPEYWIVDPRPGRSAFDAFELSDEGYYSPISADQIGKVASKILPGFIIDAKWFSDEELPDPLFLLERK